MNCAKHVRIQLYGAFLSHVSTASYHRYFRMFHEISHPAIGALYSIFGNIHKANRGICADVQVRWAPRVTQWLEPLSTNSEWFKLSNSGVFPKPWWKKKHHFDPPIFQGSIGSSLKKTIKACYWGATHDYVVSKFPTGCSVPVRPRAMPVTYPVTVVFGDTGMSSKNRAQHGDLTDLTIKNGEFHQI